MSFWNIFRKNVQNAKRKLFEGFFNQQIMIPPNMNTADFLRSYGEIGWLFACVNKISQNVADSEWNAYKGDDVAANSQALAVLKKPNEFQSKYEVLWKTSMYLELRGKAFWYIAKDKIGRPREIWVISPLDMWIIPDPNKYIKGYLYRAGTQNVPLDPDEVIFFNYPDPLNPYGGIGPSQAIANALESDKYSAQWNRNFFYNNAEPQGIVVFPEINDDDYERAKAEWQDKYRGIDNAKRTAFVRGGGVSYTPIQISQKDMDFYNLRQLNRDEILAAFGIHKSILGLTDDVSRANAETAEYTFQKHVIRPRLKLIQEKLNNEFAKLFNEDVEIKFNDPVPENKEFILQVLNGQVNKTITPNQGKNILNQLMGWNLPDIPGGDIIYQPVSWQPIGTPMPTANAASPQKSNIKSVKKKLQAKYKSLNKDAYWQTFVAKTYGQESDVKDIWRSIFDGQKDKIITALKAKKVYKADSNGDDILNFLKSDEEKRAILKKINPILKKILQERAEEIFDELELDANDANFDIHDPNVTSWLDKYCGDQITKINDTTHELIKEQLKQGEENGESIPELATRIEQYFGEMERSRCQTIARTEVIGASNKGALFGMKQSGVVNNKEWLTALDERTRPWHAEANGQVVPIDGKFIVDGEEMDCPGDPEASAENVISCRCTLLANFDEDTEEDATE